MKKSLYLTRLIIAVLFGMFLFSCNNSKSAQDKISKSETTTNEAKLAASNYVAFISSSLKDDYKIFDVTVLYESDSLCILNLKIGKGNDEKSITDNEYTYLLYKGKRYEMMGYSGNVFFSNDEFKKMGSPQTYDEAIFRKAVDAINISGHYVGRPSERLTEKIEIPYEKGDWEIADYVDDFGDEDGGHFLALIGNGVFSNTATTNSPLTVILSFDGRRNMFSFKLMEYNKTIIRDRNFYTYKIKDSTGRYGTVDLRCNDNGQMNLTLEKDSAAFTMMLKGVLRDGVMSFDVKRQSDLANDYMFKLNVTGFNEAVKSLYGIDLKKSMAKFLDE